MARSLTHIAAMSLLMVGLNSLPIQDAPAQTQPFSENRAGWNTQQAAPLSHHLRGLSGFSRHLRYHHRRPSQNRSQVIASYGVPYWKAGYQSLPLSNSCKRGEFIEKIHGKWQIIFTGKQDAAVLGVARRGNNLIDEFGVGEYGRIYLFLNSGASNCEVWVWVDSWPPRLDETFSQAQAERNARGRFNPQAVENLRWPKKLRSITVE